MESGLAVLLDDAGGKRPAALAVSGKFLVRGLVQDDPSEARRNVTATGRAQYDHGNGGNVHAGHVGGVKRDYQEGGKLIPWANPYTLVRVPREGKKAGKKVRFDRTWELPVPMLVRAMVLAGETLFVAGPGKEMERLADLTGGSPGLLWAVSADEGIMRSPLPLPASPVFDGLSAFPGGLVMACMDGKVRCARAKK